jgi:hypothetical protein
MLLQPPFPFIDFVQTVAQCTLIKPELCLYDSIDLLPVIRREAWSDAGRF